MLIILLFLHASNLIRAITFYTPSNVLIENFTVIDNKVRHQYLRTNRETSSECMFFDMQLENKNYRMCILIYDVRYDKLFKGTTIYLFQEELNNRFAYDIHEFNLTFFRGYILEKPFTTSVSGFIESDRIFCRIQMDEQLIYIESLDKFRTMKINEFNNEPKGIIYDSHHIKMNYKIFNNPYVELHSNTLKKVYSISRIVSKKKEFHKTKDTKYPKKRTACSLAVLVDNSYFVQIGKENLNLTIMYVVYTLLYTNSIFENIDFDEDDKPDNLHFYIKYLEVFHDKNTDLNFFINRQIHAIDPDIFYKMFMKWDLLENVCLGILFTTQPFENNIISFSYEGVGLFNTKTMHPPIYGGICKKYSKNAIMVSHFVDFANYVPQFLIDVSMIHELGHAFGARHNVSNNCRGYVMETRITYKSNYSHVSFSKCNKEEMLFYISKFGKCLENVQVHSCGNGIIDRNEECDCGTSHNCAINEYCCIPFNGKNTPCTVDKDSGFECVARDSFCCTKQCTYANLSLYNINCQDEEKICPCQSLDMFCECGHNGVCVEDECHSKECMFAGFLECECPETQTQYCETCCLIPSGECKTLRDINEAKIKESNVYLGYSNNLKRLSYNSISHRIWQNNDICVSKGQLGFCKHGKCDLRKSKNLFKKLLKLYQQRRRVGKYNSNYITLNHSVMSKTVKIFKFYNLIYTFIIILIYIF